MSEAAAGTGGPRHRALLYQDAAEYLAVARELAAAGLALGEPVLVAVPRPRLDWLRGELPGTGDITFTDMLELGRNPARIIPAILAFAARHAPRPIRYLGEPAWPGRSAAELAQVNRHETLLGTAVAAVPATLVCAYDAAGLPALVLTDAGCTHPALITGGRTRPSPGFLPPPGQPDPPLPPPPAAAVTLDYHRDLRPVRALVTTAARAAGLPPERATDLVIAVSEVAANTLRHTSGPGTIWLWHDGGEVICQVRDTGQITDPLAGRLPPAPNLPDSKGLWLVNQVCDLTELHTSPAGTTIRLHMQLS